MALTLALQHAPCHFCGPFGDRWPYPHGVLDKLPCMCRMTLTPAIAPLRQCSHWPSAWEWTLKRASAHLPLAATKCLTTSTLRRSTR